MKFTDEELAVVKRFLDRVSGDFLDDDEGVTGYDEDGVIVTEWETEYSYGDSYLTRSRSFIPWIAFSDPEEHARQVEAERQERRRLEQERLAAYAAQREAEERSVLAQLRAKYES